MKKSILLEESLMISINVIDIYKQLTEKNEYILSNQLLRSATSIGANLREGKYSESKKDFIHKFTIALKECYETLYWLEIIKYKESNHMDDIDIIIKRCNSILRMISSSIKTCKNNLNNQFQSEK